MPSLNQTSPLPGVAVLEASPGEAAAPLRPHPEMPPPDEAGAQDREAQLAAYLTEKFLYTYHHPFWERFREQATEDHAFNTGTEQWDKTAKQKLIAAGRAVLQIQEIRPVIEIVKGYEAAAPLEGKPVPVGPEDLEDVLIFERLGKHAAKRSQTEHEASEGFGVGIVGGLSAWYVGVDYSRDFIYGEPSLEVIPWAHFCHDPGSRKYDLTDAGEIFWHKRVRIDDLTAQYPDKKKEIEAGLALIAEDGKDGLDGLVLSPHVLPAKDRADGYLTPFRTAGGVLLGGLQLYDRRAKEVTVVEASYRTWDWDTVMIDKRLNRSMVVPKAVLSLAEELAKIDPQVRLVKKAKRQFTMCVFLPVTKTYLAGGQPFENDPAYPPFVQFLAYREGDEILGLVRNLKDMQRDVNKRRSSAADYAGRAGRYKLKAHRASVERPEDLEDDTVDVYWLNRPDMQGVQEMSPPAWPAWMTQLAETGKAEIREASLMNAPLQGQAQASQSGRAVGMLQQQGQIGMASLFRNYKRSRYLLTRAFLKRVQQCYSAEKTLRLEMGAGETAWVTINEHTVAADGTMQVVRDIPSLDWDVEIIDTPLTPTARMAHLILWLEVLSKFPPEYAESVADITMELMDTPHREEAIQRFRAIMARKGLLVQANQVVAGLPTSPPAGGNGTPPGVRPGLAARAMAGPLGVPEGMMNAPTADTLRAVGAGMGGMM